MELFGFLPIDKPLGWTSHDVVARLRRITGTRRVGHAGTLDPAATGVLVTGIGRATRFLDYVQESSKEYIAHIVLGADSGTADVDGRILESVSLGTSPGRDAVEQTLRSLTGEIDQIPPKYSAVKQAGEPLYRKARRGEAVDVPVRRVRVDRLQVIEYRYPDLILSVTCGPGVYIRSLAQDLGSSLECGGYLHHLLRTRVGRFQLEQCWSLDELAACLSSESWSTIATATDLGTGSIPSLWLSGERTVAWYHGRSVRAKKARDQGGEPVRAMTDAGEFAGLGTSSDTSDETQDIRPRIVLATN